MAKRGRPSAAREVPINIESSPPQKSHQGSPTTQPRVLSVPSRADRSISLPREDHESRSPRDRLTTHVLDDLLSNGAQEETSSSWQNLINVCHVPVVAHSPSVIDEENPPTAGPRIWVGLIGENGEIETETETARVRRLSVDDARLTTRDVRFRVKIPVRATPSERRLSLEIEACRKGKVDSNRTAADDFAYIPIPSDCDVPPSTEALPPLAKSPEILVETPRQFATRAFAQVSSSSSHSPCPDLPSPSGESPGDFPPARSDRRVAVDDDDGLDRQSPGVEPSRDDELQSPVTIPTGASLDRMLNAEEDGRERLRDTLRRAVRIVGKRLKAKTKRVTHHLKEKLQSPAALATRSPAAASPSPERAVPTADVLQVDGVNVPRHATIPIRGSNMLLNIYIVPV